MIQKIDKEVERAFMAIIEGKVAGDTQGF